MTIIYHKDVIQGTDEWFALRCGMITASQMSLILTPKTLKAADNEKTRTHLYELLAQRVTHYVEPQYISDDMLRGQDDEVEALAIYRDNIAPIEQVGFITNDAWGFKLGYSPDALVGDDGLVEVKSRRQKYQMQTFIENVTADQCPPEFMLQVQTGLLVTGRQWLDFVSYCAGMPLAVVRCYPDEKVHEAIIEACSRFEESMRGKMAVYDAALAKFKPIKTERLEGDMPL